jgi:hypothetical protein
VFSGWRVVRFWKVLGRAPARSSIAPPTARVARSPESAGPLDLRRFQDTFAVVILPTLNEEAGLARTLRDLPTDRFSDAGRRVQPLIIDGGSTDGTLEVARQWGVPVLHQASRGKGGAMLEAIAWVHRQKIPYVVVLDADATYPPDRILPALELLARGTDLVVGVRRRVWGPPADVTDLVHRVGNLALSYSASVLSRRPILDLCSGFWGVSTQRFMDLELADATFAIEAELFLKSIRRGYSIHQIPVEYRERLGVAKLRAFRDGRRILRTIVREARPAPSRPTAHGTHGTWARDLLSIALVVGASGPDFEVPPSEAEEAGRVARLLRRTTPASGTPPRADRRFSVRPPDVTGRTAAPDSDRLRLTLSLPRERTDRGTPRQATVSIQSARRVLTVQLPLAPAPPSTGAAWTRSGGWMPGPVGHRARASSLLVLTSRLDFRPDHQEETLLAANGFHILDLVRDLDEPEILPALHALASDR